MIRGLTIATGAIGLAYGGYWFAAAHAARTVADRAIADLRAEGFAVDAKVTVQGFPSRIDTTFADLSISDPASGIGWQAPWFQIFALSYSPNRIIAAWSPEQIVTLPGATLTIGSESLMASARVALSTDLALDNLTAEGRALTVAADGGIAAGAAHVLAALRRAEGLDYDLFAEITDIALPDPLRARLDPEGALPGTVPLVRLDGQVTLDAPIARGTRPALLSLTLRDLRADWGDAGLSVSGTVTPDAQGYASGTLDLTLRNWPLLVTLAVNAGLIAPDQAGLWTGALQAAAMGDVSLTAPVTFGNGMASIGPLPLGAAPRLTYSQ